MNCKQCGIEIPFGTTYCNNCSQSMNQTGFPVQGQTYVSNTVSENVITGTIGALVGAVIGAIVIILLGRLNLVASISGFILALCTLKGYELLGKQMSLKGFIICLVLIIITPYFADRLDWAIRIKEVFSYISLGEAFSSVPEFIKLGLIEKSNYIMGLIMIYVFAGAGAIGLLHNQLKK